ncbi:hypothetical protein [Stackebrandtia soli]|uniref:hypothetical protein n=1 Tax=Stackebrandtia soli TaxID=1892856 RepID=UPI0039E782B9
MTEPQPLSPEATLRRADTFADTVRRADLWRIAGWWIVTAFACTVILGRALFPAFLDAWDLILLGVTCALLLGIAAVAKVYDRRYGRIEIAVIVGLTVAAGIGAALSAWVLPDPPTVGHWIIGFLPVVPTSLATWWAARQ